MNSKYFFLGLPARYALIDTFTRAIWLVTNDLEVALDLRHIFSYTKLNLIVFDLESYENYAPDLIDNTVCLNWQAPLFTNIVIVETSIISNMFNHVHKEKPGQNLGNQKVQFRLSTDRVADLQNQLFLAHHFLTLFNQIPNPNYARGILQELRGTADHTDDNLVIQEFKRICRTELSLQDIEQALYTMSTEHMDTDSELRVSALILRELGRLYA
jgi:hypothetical protein